MLVARRMFFFFYQEHTRTLLQNLRGPASMQERRDAPFTFVKYFYFSSLRHPIQLVEYKAEDINPANKEAPAASAPEHGPISHSTRGDAPRYNQVYEFIAKVEIVTLRIHHILRILHPGSMTEPGLC